MAFIRNILLTLLFILIFHCVQSQQQNKNIICLSKEELRLYNLISSLRIENGLELIPLSTSLTQVAQTHIKDLAKNHPDTSICNYHSWSDKGDWTACCYNSYILEPECMWDKPGELTDYDYPAYELVIWDSEQADPDSLMQTWASVDISLNMFIQDGKWAKKEWNAVGVGLNENYASIWFGERNDKLPPPNLCGSDRQLSMEELESTEIISKAKDVYYLNESNTYHIIFGSFSRFEEAKSSLENLKQNFPEAGIIKGENNFRISLESHPSLQEAKNKRDQLGDQFKKAWILKF